MMVLILDRIVRRELGEVVRLKLDNVGEEVAALQGEVLNDEVQRIVTVLDTGNRDVADLLDEGGEDDFTDVTPELGLEFERTFAVEEEVACEAGPVFTKLFVKLKKWLLVTECEIKCEYMHTGSSPIALNQSPTLLKRLSKCPRYLSS